MYAIAFDLDTDLLKSTYPAASWTNAYFDVRGILEKHGFSWQQGSVYFGDERVTPVTCVVAIHDLSKRFDWFATCVRDIRMLRIEENNDLTPAIALD
jgi:virulence-associated protein VapD